MPDRLICNRVLAQIMSYHFRLNFNWEILFPVVNTNREAHHLGENDRVAVVSADGDLLPVLQCPPGLLQLLEELLLAVRDAALQAPPLAGWQQLEELVHI